MDQRSLLTNLKSKLSDNVLGWPRSALIYQLMIDRFATSSQRFEVAHVTRSDDSLREWMGGNLKGVIESLDYIRNLGVDTILLSPFMRSKKYHGYWITDYRSVDEHFGTTKELALLVDQAHNRGIRVLMDMPITHCHISNEGFCRSPNDEKMLVRNNEGELIGFFGDSNLPEIDLDQVAVQVEILSILRYWLDYGFDGIRFDHAKRPSRSFWRFLVQELKGDSPERLLLGENWTELGEVGNLHELLDGELNVPVALAMRNFLRKPDAKSVAEVIGAIGQQTALREQGYILPTYLDNHDLERAAFLAHGDERLLRLGYLILMTLPYPVILYNGSERGQTQTVNLAEGVLERDRYFREPTMWESGSDIAAWIRNLAHLRNALLPVILETPIIFDNREYEAMLRYSYRSDDRVIEIVANYGISVKRVSISGTATLLGTTHPLQYQTMTDGMDLVGYQGVVLQMENPRTGMNVTNPDEETVA